MTLLGAGGAAKSILAQAILDGVSQIFCLLFVQFSMEKNKTLSRQVTGADRL